MNIKVDEFRFLDRTVPSTWNPIWGEHWSRPYEYGLIVERLRDYKVKSKFKTCHNTACGFLPIHRSFYEMIEDCFEVTENSDLFAMSQFPNYHTQDLLLPAEKTYDVVVCISAIEHFSPDQQEIVLGNLIEQTKPGGKIIVTCDYPDVNVTSLEKILGASCSKPREILSGNNSLWPMACFGNLNIIYLEMTKL